MENEGMQFYRCTLCNGVVSWWDIQEHHACKKCGNGKIKPSDLSFWEKLIQIIKHPAIWRWNAAL
jgi:DNA-directed RNA polymerase subunit RPC12/RpoP